METLFKTQFEPGAKHFSCRVPMDMTMEDFKAKLIDINELRNILVLRNQFFYITDITDSSNVFVSKTLKDVLGYAPEYFRDLAFVYRNIHPDDVDFIYAFSQRTIALSYKYKTILLHNPLAAVFSIDFRMRTILGEYIRVNRQTCCFKTDLLGNMVYAISLFTDINHIKHSNLITFACKSEINVEYELDDLIEKYHNNLLTCRESEIIRYLSQGMSATQIGKKLFISEHTVIAHRKHILHKIGAKNTAQLIKYAMEYDLI